MLVTLNVPDELAAALSLANGDPAHAALEAIALEAFRERRISAYQLRTLLGFSSRFELYAFLKERRIETYSAEDFEHDIADLDVAPPAA